VTPRRASAIAAIGERRIAERRVAPLQPDLTTGLINRLTADRDRLKWENEKLRELLSGNWRMFESAAKIAAKETE